MDSSRGMAFLHPSISNRSDMKEEEAMGDKSPKDKEKKKDKKKDKKEKK
jgi:hypothetical protein